MRYCPIVRCGYTELKKCYGVGGEVMPYNNSDVELFEYNDKVANEKIMSVIRYMNIIIPVLFLGVALGTFKGSYANCFFTSIVLIAITFIEKFLCENEKLYKVAKWFGLISLHCIICFTGVEFGISIFLLYCAVPVISCFYFDRNFTLKIIVICYLIMIFTLFKEAVGTFAEPEEWFATTGSTYSFEYFIFAIITTGVSETVHNIINKLNEQNESIQKMQTRVVMGFADLVESRDKNTGQHVRRTSEYVSLIIEKLRENGYYKDELTEKNAKMIIATSPLHDVGKISIPDSILCKPGKLTDKEYNIIKTHTLRGAEIIEHDLNVDGNDAFYTTARNMALYHHERWDGTGYPCRIKGESIPLCARIMSAADVLDALLSKRAYKSEFSFDKAFEIIEKGSGTQFEPCIVEAVMQLRPQIEEMSRS
jgi:HD-GYP domain-containing protein (c-di-GMP phosphodiesterase class II)